MTILIVDDELMIQNWLSLLLQKTEKYQVDTLTASNASEALSICKKQSIDLIITDINMPHVNGLELLEQVKETYPNIETVVLSAYDNFEYIRSALKLNCIDYILKSHLCQDDINNILDKVANMSDYSSFNRRYSDEEFQKTQKFNDSLQKFLEDQPGNFDELNHSSGDRLSIDGLCLITMQLSMCLESKNAICALLEISRKVLQLEKNSGATYLVYGDMLVILFNSNSKVAEHKDSLCRKLCLLIKGTIEKNCDYEVLYNTYYSSIHNEGDLQDNILNSIRFLQFQTYYHGEKGLIAANNLDNHIDTSETASLIESLKTLVNNGNLDKSELLFKSYVDKMHAQHIFPSEIIDMVSHTITIIYILAAPHHIVIEELTQFRLLINNLYAANSKSKVIDVINTFFSMFFTHDRNITTLHPQISKVKDFISKNFALPISLEETAAEVFLSKNYLSSLFKSELGISFNDYVETVRIQNSKILLLNTRQSMSEIATNVGFSSQSYFSKVFKRHTGMTPMQYRNLSGKNMPI